MKSPDPKPTVKPLKPSPVEEMVANGESCSRCGVFLADDLAAGVARLCKRCHWGLFGLEKEKP